MRRAVVFNYESIFAPDIERSIRRFNASAESGAFAVDMYRARDCSRESLAGPADVIIHSGGDGTPVTEDAADTPRLYICHSHQWKARQEGGAVVPLGDFIKGVQLIDILEDDDILGKKGSMPIMEYHMLGVVSPPRCARVLAKSRARDENGRDVEIIEALRYPDGSVSVQGHPEEGAAAHILYNFLRR
jgi:GMP synthase-like glutamine amidotransferase